MSSKRSAERWPALLAQRDSDQSRKSGVSPVGYFAAPRCARLVALPVGIAHFHRERHDMRVDAVQRSAGTSALRARNTWPDALAMLRLEAQAEGDTEVRPFVGEAGIDAKHRITLEGHTKADPVVHVYACPGQRVE
jgi:hypothetical protein